jgi:F0F1-type ATP synthase membrane subunit b/b'
MNLLLQIFLYIDVFIIGVLVSLVYRHARAHFDDKKNQAKPKPNNGLSLNPERRQKLVAEAEEKFQHVINRSVDQFEQELKTTTDQVTGTIAKEISEITARENSKLTEMFKQYEQQAINELVRGRTETEQLKNDLKAKLAEDIAQEKQQRIDLIDERLSSAVISFLTEVLQHEVDLGSQEDYLLSQLEGHKDELKQAVKNET